MPHDMFGFNALLIYQITLEIKSMVHLKSIACSAEAVGQIVNEWNNPFFYLDLCGLLNAKNQSLNPE